MDTSEEVEMFVVGLVLDPATNAPIVILKDASGEICLPIWIGLAEATAIASVLKKIELARPMTHDLLKNTIEEIGARVVKVMIHGLQENTFLASIELAVGDAMKNIDSRPSDAIALAVRVNAPIMVSPHVLARAQVTLVSVPSLDFAEGEEAESEGGDENIKRQNFANIEKDQWAEILAAMDPDDFKYKM